MVTQRTSKGDLRALIQELVQTTTAYALQVLAHADLSKPAEAERAAWMLEPIEKHRARNTSNAHDAIDEDDDEDTQPTAEIDKSTPANDGNVGDGRRVA